MCVQQALGGCFGALCFRYVFVCFSLGGVSNLLLSEISSQDKGIKESTKVTEWVVDNIYRPGDLIHLLHVSDPDELGGKVSLCIVYFCFRLRARASRRMGVGDPSVRAVMI